MNNLIIYDDTGFILSNVSGAPAPREPIGVPFLWAEIPEGKRIKITNGIGVDVSVTPNQLILEDIPKSETQLLKEQVLAQEEALIELATMLSEVLG